MKSFVIVLLTGLLIGCAACTRFYDNFYEGIRMQQLQEALPDIDVREQVELLPSYDEYRRQRRLVTGETPRTFAPAAVPTNP